MFEVPETAGRDLGPACIGYPSGPGPVPGVGGGPRCARESASRPIRMLRPLIA